MRNWNLLTVIGVAVAYVALALLLIRRDAHARGRAAGERYVREHRENPKSNYTMTAEMPTWHTPAIFIPPTALLGYWVVAQLLR